MKRLLTATALVFAAAMAAARPPEDVAQALMKLENDWAKAGLAGDTAALEKMLASDYVYTNPEGGMSTRADTLSAMKSGATKYDIFTVSDMKVHVYGDAAVVTGTGHTKGKEDGKPIDDTVRFTDTWVKQGGNWVCVATHVTRLPKK